MKTNKLAIVGSIVLTVIVFALLAKGCSSGSPDKSNKNTPSGSSSNASADTTANSLLAVTAQYQEVKADQEEMKESVDQQNAQLKQQSDALQRLIDKLDGIEAKASQAERQADTASTQLSRYEDKLRQMVSSGEGQSATSAREPSDGHKVAEGGPYQVSKEQDNAASSPQYLLNQLSSKFTGKGNNSAQTVVDPAQRFVWFEQPQTRETALEVTQASGSPKNDRTASGNKPSKKVRKLTINPLATSFEVTALTALVGRIPVNGTTPDPYRVKLIIGRDNLAANGIFFDGVSGMIVGGWAKGDWNLSCVDVELDSYAFVFDDGTISAMAPNSSDSSESLGYISMPNGFPCVPGEFHTNAPSYLTQSALLNGIKTAGEAYAAKQTTQEDLPLGGQRTTVSGDTGKYVLGEMASGAVDDSISWIRERQQSSFDAVVAPPGMTVVVHFEQQIEIDYDPNGRRVNHDASQVSGRFLD